jgi:hypothetical protein
MVCGSAPRAQETFSRLRRTVGLSRGPLNADVRGHFELLIMTRLSAATLVVAYLVLMVIVGAFSIHYEMILDGMIEHMPPLTQWTFHAYRYTPLFLFLAFPAILCAITTRLSTTLRRISMAVSVGGLVLLAAWFGVIWLGMGLVVAKLEAI